MLSFIYSQGNRKSNAPQNVSFVTASFGTGSYSISHIGTAEGRDDVCKTLEGWRVIDQCLFEILYKAQLVRREVKGADEKVEDKGRDDALSTKPTDTTD